MVLEHGGGGVLRVSFNDDEGRQVVAGVLDAGLGDALGLAERAAAVDDLGGVFVL